MKDLTLIYPQWQGSIDNEALFKGAYELADNIQGLPSPKEVKVAPFYELKHNDSIVGKKDIIEQFRLAGSILQKEDPDRVLLIGGDCSTDAVPVTWLNRKHEENLALIWFDAHPDLNTPLSSKSGRFQGMALSAILGLAGAEINNSIFAPLKPEQVFCAGPRVFDPHELEYIVVNKVPFFGPGELERDPSWLAGQIKRAGFTRVYIHLDVDAINPMGFPHSKKSPPDGLLLGNLLKIIKELHSRLEISGLGITEFHPGNERGINKARQIIKTALPDLIKGINLLEE